jgi:hypothetical protein
MTWRNSWMLIEGINSIVPWFGMRERRFAFRNCHGRGIQ